VTGPTPRGLDLAAGGPTRAPDAAARSSRRGRGGGPGRYGIGVLATLAALFLGLPILVLVARAVLVGTLAEIAGSPAIIDALTLSLITTSASLVLTVLLGGPLAYVLARRRFRGAWVVETIVDLPIVLPPAVAGLALLLLFGRRGIIGGALDDLGIDIPFTTAAVVLAQVFVAAPFFIRSARTGLAGVDRDLEDAARVDGAAERDVIARVTLPLASSALAAGLVMCWARALGEFGATIMFAGNVPGRTQTLPLLVYAEFQSGDLDAAIAAAAILVLAAVGVLVAVRVLHWGRALDLRTST
jgi:molybdate transport system permease protein